MNDQEKNDVSRFAHIVNTYSGESFQARKTILEEEIGRERMEKAEYIYEMQGEFEEECHSAQYN